MLTDSAPRRTRVRSGRGFSLIELTLVVVILGVLMAVVAVNVLGQGEKAKKRATEVSMNTIQSQLDAYHLEYSAYPPALVTLQQVDGFLGKNKSIKDGWKRDFLYRAPGSSGMPYDLISMGGNIDDPGDDINIWTMDQDQ
jgi:general secretion pathway protein G